MKITINKRIESCKNMKNQLENQQENDKQSNRYQQHKQNIKERQYQDCGRWFFQRCLRKPSNVSEQEPQNHCLAFKSTTVGFHQLKSKSAFKKNSNNPKKPPKINIFSIKSKSATKNNDYNQYPSLIYSKNPTGTTLSKQVYFQGKISDYIQTKQCTQAQKSYQNSNKNSTTKLKTKILDFSLKPSTINSSKNNSKNLQKSKQNKTLYLSDNYNQIISKEIIPFSINDISQLSSERIYTDRIKKIEQKGQEFNFEGYSRFQLIQIQDHSPRQRDDGSDNSIATSYLKKNIQFSEQKSQREKMQDCLYQPLYIPGTPRTPQSELKIHHSHRSQLIKAIQVDDERYFDSNKLNSDESIVLEKGLQEIFSPKDTCEDNWSGYFMGYQGVDKIIEDS